MRKILIIVISFLIFIACNSNLKESHVLIQSESDTIELDAIYRAELYIDHLGTIMPDFYILHNNDTFLLPFAEDKDHAVFQAVGRKIGGKSYKGYVDFKNTKGDKSKQHFEILFYVNDSVESSLPQ